jgi:hypothetical protein
MNFHANVVPTARTGDQWLNVLLPMPHLSRAGCSTPALAGADANYLPYRAVIRDGEI